MAQYRTVRDLDWPLLFFSLTICGLGVLQIYSATVDTVASGSWWKQIVWIGIGLVLMWITSRIDYHALMDQVPLMYGLSIGTLAAVFLVGKIAFGSRRWVPLPGGFHFQISEFMKVVLVLFIARYMTQLRTQELEARDLLKAGAFVGLPMLMVMKQPDLGTALTYLPILAAGVFLAGLRWQYLAVILIAAGLIIPISWHFLQDYQKARLVSFQDPMADPKGSGYQVIQSKIAVGGIWGRGVTHGTQTQLGFLPVAPMDFIFSAFAEEHGFVGVVVVLGLYFLLIMQIVQNAQMSPDRAGMFICMGIAALVLFHVLVNVGMVVGRMPVTGIPLPLMSYGGSNTFTTFLLLGLVNNVRLRRFVN